jgi:hypothetical protein
MADFMNEATRRMELARQERGEVLPSAQEQHDLEQAARRDEDNIVDLARANALKALRYEDKLLDKVKDSRDVPQALRAVADSRAKSVETLMKLTGRDVHRPPTTSPGCSPVSPRRASSSSTSSSRSASSDLPDRLVRDVRHRGAGLGEQAHQVRRTRRRLPRVRPRYSHAFLIVSERGDIVEAVKRGVRLAHISKYEPTT